MSFFHSWISTLSFSFFCFCHSFVEETSHLSCRVSHIPDSANCIPLVFLNLFLCPFISYIQVVSSGGLSRIRFDFLTKRLELLRQRNEVTKRARVVALGKKTLRWHPLGSQVGDRRNRAPQTSIGFRDAQLLVGVSSRLVSSHLISPCMRGLWDQMIPLAGQLELDSNWLSWEVEGYSSLLSWFCSSFLPFFP